MVRISNKTEGCSVDVKVEDQWEYIITVDSNNAKKLQAGAVMSCFVTKWQGCASGKRYYSVEYAAITENKENSTDVKLTIPEEFFSEP